jgi:hypothetical protein
VLHRPRYEVTRMHHYDKHAVVAYVVVIRATHSKNSYLALDILLQELRGGVLCCSFVMFAQMEIFLVHLSTIGARRNSIALNFG